MEKNKKCCENCNRLFTGNICSIDKMFIKEPYDTICQAFEIFHQWTLEDLKTSFCYCKNYLVVKKMDNNTFIMDRMRKKKNQFIFNKEYIKMTLPLFNRGTYSLNIGDIITIHQDGDVNYIGKIDMKDLNK
jgi:hypothetical protein